MPQPTSSKFVATRKTILSGGFLAVCAVVYVAATLLAPLPKGEAILTAVSGPSENRVAASPVWPPYGSGAIGAVGFDGPLAAHGDPNPVPIASITKVITALVVLEKKPLAVGENGPEITLTEADVATFRAESARGASVVPVAAGSTFTERQFLEAMLIPSSSNHAESLATWAFGSPNDYVKNAAPWLVNHGLTHTTVVDASGFSDENVSSTADLLELAKLALASPTITAVVNERETTLPGVGTFANSNALLGVDGIYGIKTGTAGRVGTYEYGLLFAQRLVTGAHTVTIIGVLLGGPTRSQLNDDITRLLSSTKGNFHEVTTVTQNQPFGTYKTAWEHDVPIVSAAASTVVTWSNTPISITAVARAVDRENDNTEVGTVNVTSGSSTTTTPLILSEPIAEPGWWWRLTHPVSLVG